VVYFVQNADFLKKKKKIVPKSQFCVSLYIEGL